MILRVSTLDAMQIARRKRNPRDRAESRGAELRNAPRFNDTQLQIATRARLRRSAFSFFYSICTSVSPPVALRGVVGSFVFLYPGLSCSLLLFWIVAFALQGNPCRRFPRKVAVLLLYSAFTVLRHLRCPVQAPYALAWRSAALSAAARDNDNASP